jgi:cytochrome bd-type quinol oxidase subunit 1
MFSSGQLIFAAIFAICFIIVIIFSYRKDLKIHKQYYKGSLWILVSFLLFISLLFVIKSLMKE